LEEPVFIVGLPRSGTTLLASILAAHPAFAVSPETHFLNRWLPTFRTDLPGVAAVQELLDRFCGFERFPQLGLDPAVLRDRATGERVEAPRALFTLLLDEVRRERGRARIVEKTPDHDQHVETLLSWYPDCRVVWMVRDPRAVLASTRKVPWTALTHPRPLAGRWRASVRRLEALSRDGRVTSVRYESLVADPEREARRLCALLHEEFRTEMLAGERPRHYATVIHEWGRSHLERARGPIDEASVEKWRQELTQDDIGLLEILCGRALTRWGYSPVARRYGLRVVLRAAGRRLAGLSRPPGGDRGPS